MAESVMFVPECHVDTALARTLLFQRLTFINHQKGIPKVASVLEAQAATGKGPRFVVGMVDRDKKFADVKYLRHFREEVAAFAGTGSRHHIFRHVGQPTHFLVVLEPACDTWLFEAARTAGLALGQYGLPDTLAGFIKYVKEEDIEEDRALMRLLEAIRQAQPPAYQALATFVASVMDPL